MDTDTAAYYRRVLEEQLDECAQELEAVEHRQERLINLRARLDSHGSPLDLDDAVFRVLIRIPDEVHPRSATERGLGHALAAAEQHLTASGQYTYEVWALLPGIDLPINREIWQACSSLDWTGQSEPVAT